MYGPGQAVPEGTTVYYHCDNGYRLAHDSRQLLMCERGQWNSDFPTCVSNSDESMTCRYPAEIPYGSRVVHDHKNVKIESSRVPDGSVVQYTCNFGYKLQGKQQSLCTKGLWRDRQPSCMPILGCGQPPTIPHGDLSYLSRDSDSMPDKLPGGTKVYYFCNDGYQMKKQDIATLVCEDGKWQGKKPVCGECWHM